MWSCRSWRRRTLRSCLRKCFCSSTEAVSSHHQLSSVCGLCRLSLILKPFCPFLSRRPRVHVQTHPACTALSTQVSAGCFCQPGDGGHLLQHWHDGDDRHSCSTNIWPLAWWQGEKHNRQLLIFLSLKRGRFTFCRRSLPCCWVRWEISCPSNTF